MRVFQLAAVQIDVEARRVFEIAAFQIACGKRGVGKSTIGKIGVFDVAVVEIAADKIRLSEICLFHVKADKRNVFERASFRPGEGQGRIDLPVTFYEGSKGKIYERAIFEGGGKHQAVAEFHIDESAGKKRYAFKAAGDEFRVLEFAVFENAVGKLRFPHSLFVHGFVFKGFVYVFHILIIPHTAAVNNKIIQKRGRKRLTSEKKSL